MSLPDRPLTNPHGVWPLAPGPRIETRLWRLACVAVAIATWVVGVGTEAVTPENRLKAAYISKIPQFVTWPATAWDGRDSIEICVGAPNPFGSELNELVADASSHGRRYAVRELKPNEPVNGCHVLFVGSSSARERDALLTKTSGLPILTIGDSADFLGQNGIVAFRVVEGRLRFAINLTAAQRAGLQISSQLLRLAVAVQGVAS